MGRMLRGVAENTAGLRLGLLAVLFGLTAAGAALAIEDQGTSVEECVACHATGQAVPVGDVNNLADPHFTDTNALGPLTDSGYRQLNVQVTSVDLSNPNIVIEFTLTDENGSGIDNVYDDDGQLYIARLEDGRVPGDPNTAGNPIDWRRLASERFTDSEGSFENLENGNYRYTTSPSPASPAIENGDPLRFAVQVYWDDLPTGNGWCDFDASFTALNTCTGTSINRDIVQTSTCNDCHGVTSDTKLSFHGDRRTEVELCVVCHNPPNFAEEMTTMTHKIHYGSELTQEYRDGDFEHVVFTKDIEDCTTCHNGDGASVDNWKLKPTRSACGSCHDDIDFGPEGNHGNPPIPQENDRLCVNCHPDAGEWTAQTLPIPAVHQGVARNEEGAEYRGDGNGYAMAAAYDRATGKITVDYSATRALEKMNLATDDRWKNGARLRLRIAWSSTEITNEGSGSTPAPAQPIDVNALDIGGAIMDLGEGNYRAVIDKPESSFDTVVVGLEGHPQADLRGIGLWESIPVKSVVANINVEPRGTAMPRRHVVDMDKCNACHDMAGAGLSLHGNNRAGEMQVCVLCHNGDATDIAQRPADPADALDGKKEESIDMKRMAHQIHMGKDLDPGIVVYGFMGSDHDYREVGFMGNMQNCLSCHEPGTYSTDAAARTLSTTVDTGAEITDPFDDLNISPITSVCSSCHDTERAVQHMVLNGGTFGSLDGNISVTAAPEPGMLELSLAALGSLGVLARRRNRRGAAAQR